MTEISIEKQQLVAAAVGSLPMLNHGPDADHVFDPFEFEGVEYFFHYLGGAKCWTTRAATGGPWCITELEQGDEDIAAVPSAPRFMPSPTPSGESIFPMNLWINVGQVTQGPFWYRDQEYIWSYDVREHNWAMYKMLS